MGRAAGPAALAAAWPDAPPCASSCSGGGGGRETSRPWQTQRAAVYQSGRTEVAFSDGSGLVVHPRAERASYFCRDGSRLRLLTACAPQRGTLGPSDGTEIARQEDDLRAKVSAAVALRNRFHASPAAQPGLPGPTVRRHVRASRASWPSPAARPAGGDHAAAAAGTGAAELKVASVDGSASLSLAPHGLTYSVEWWQPVDEAASVSLLKGIGEAPAEVSAPVARGQRLFSADGAAVGIYHEHALRVQHFAVADPAAPAWVYPLLLVLSERRESAAEFAREPLDAQLASLACQLRDHIAAGRVVEEPDGTVTAPLPSSAGARASAPAAPEAWSSDAVSPASALGVAGEGPVHVVWTAAATTWFHLAGASEGEATLDAGGGRVAGSTQQGRFWRHSCGECEEVLCADVLPADGAHLELSRQVAEASRWLRRNRAEMGAAACAQGGGGFAAPLPPLGAGWLPEADLAEEGVGCISVFRPAGAAGVANTSRLVRILFDDASRLQCVLHADASGVLRAPGAGDCFRLLTSRGQVVLRSFGEPAGCEEHADLARRFIGRVAADPADGPHKSAAVTALLAEQQRRRGALLLQLRGIVGAKGAPA